MTSPGIDAGTRQRLTARFGRAAEAWFDELPGVLTALAGQWHLDLGPPIPRGSVSAVYRCRMADGRRAVLKISPDRARLAFEAAALGAWATCHTPAVIALDEQAGALLTEAIEPGTPLDLSSAYPAAEAVAELLSSLHGSGVPGPSYPAVAQRVAYLFGASAKLYDRHPELAVRRDERPGTREPARRPPRTPAGSPGSRLACVTARRGRGQPVSAAGGPAVRRRSPRWRGAGHARPGRCRRRR